MKILSTSVIIILVFSILGALAVYPPESNVIKGKDREFLGIPISEKTVKTAEKTVRGIEEIGTLAIPRSVKYIITEYKKTFSIIGNELSALYEA